MVFNSMRFYLFLICVVVLFYVLPKRLRVILLLAASYYFYLLYKPIYGLLLVFVTVSTYIFAILISKAESHRKVFLALCLFLNFGLLFYFKYFNFFLGSVKTLDILLPIGISFFTFQSLGYVIDVYRDPGAAETNFIKYALFISFFPQLVAGPIEKSGNLLPQLQQDNLTKIKFTFENFRCGLLLLVWGLFKKIVVADTLAVIVNAGYASVFDSPPVLVLISVLAFPFQIYCDFSAYSDIARGSARLIGINLMENFKAPFLSASVREFWGRWHISLSSWFKSYVYIPLGGNKKGRVRTYLNTLAVFVLSGLWHGASVTFLVWGGLNGIYQAVENMLGNCFKKIKGNIFIKAAGCIFTFILIALAFIFFRAKSVGQGIDILSVICRGNFDWAALTQTADLPQQQLFALLLCLGLLFAVDVATCFKVAVTSVYLTYICLIVLFMIIVTFGHYGTGYDPQAFIYFQF